MSDNTLMVSKTLTFPKLMSIAEGMSYKHETYYIKARGKQVQRAVEVAAMLMSRDRGKIKETDIQYETHDIQVPTIQITMMVSR
tara:strand:- start:3650 stop:3901 length:252 start_codon:yes stop_codon:yes gene_type:complete